MSVKAVGSGDRVQVPAGTTHKEIGVLVRDAAGAPVTGAHVVFEAKRSGAVFPDASGRAAQTVKTDANGEAWARIQPIPGGPRLFDVSADAGTHGAQTFGIEVTPATPYNNGGPAPTPPPPSRSSSGVLWPVVVLLGIIIAGLLVWKAIDKTSGSGPTQPPVVIHQGGGGGSNVDPVARADAQAARAGVEAAKQELGLAIDTGLAGNAAHDQGYAREYTRPVLRQALVTARQVRERLGSADGKPAICGIDPSLAACRE